MRPLNVFLLAIGLHMGALAIREGPEVYTENLRAGVTLVEKGYLGDPFILPTGPTGHLSPVYPIVAAAAYGVTGDVDDMRTVLEVVCAIVASIAAALLVPLARALRLPAGSGALAGLFWSVPLFAMVELSAEHETVFSVAAVVVVLTVASRVLRTTIRTRDGAVLGAATGVGAHFTPLILPMMLLGLGASLLVRRTRVRVRPGFVLAFALALCAVVTPYTVRNWQVMGAPFFIRDNFGLEIAVSNADNAKPTAEENIEQTAAMATHPFKSRAAALQVREMGEVAYNRSRLREGLTWIRTHPSQFLELTLVRTGFLIVPASHRLAQRVASLLMAMGFLASLIVLWRSGHRGTAALLAGAVAGYDFMYPFVQHDVRYVYPMLRVQSLGAASVAVPLLARLAAWKLDDVPEGSREPSPRGVPA